MSSGRAFLRIAAGLFPILLFSIPAAGQTPSTEEELWWAVDGYFQLPSSLALRVFGELREGEDFPFNQVNSGVGLDDKWKRADWGENTYVVLGGAYEHRTTIQSGTSKHENRFIVETTPRIASPGGFRLDDRNRVEFRWVDGDYSTRYRNRLTVDHDLVVHDFRVAPYASAEAYYDGAQSSWTTARYSAGIKWPAKGRVIVDTYYLRQDCSTCSPRHVNVGGLTLSLYFGNEE
ncbi:MAG: DUF2490 domain-containing protein [Vicinamibacterales bacterium]